MEWPLLVFLHGSEEYGDGSEAQLPKVLKNGIPTMIAAGEWPAELPFVVLMPQYSFAEANGPCALNDEIESVIEWADRTYRIDPARIYLTGISCGAIGVLDYLAGSQERRVAATVPISSAPYAGSEGEGRLCHRENPNVVLPRCPGRHRARALRRGRRHRPTRLHEPATEGSQVDGLPGRRP